MLKSILQADVFQTYPLGLHFCYSIKNINTPTHQIFIRVPRFPFPLDAVLNQSQTIALLCACVCVSQSDRRACCDILFWVHRTRFKHMVVFWDWPFFPPLLRLEINSWVLRGPFVSCYSRNDSDIFGVCKRGIGVLAEKIKCPV